MATYRTKQGDTWDGIAFLTLGSEAHMQELMRMNRAHVNTLVFDAGVQLEMPEIAPVRPPELPPWKR